jgi:hypothetical protein
MLASACACADPPSQSLGVPGHVLVCNLLVFFACAAVHLSQLIASDVVWSDPSRLPGHEANTLRGVGTRWGADVTEVCHSPAPPAANLLDFAKY